MLSLKKIRELTVAAPSTPGRPLYVSAASGLVAAGTFLYVVADDEHHLGVFSASGDEPGSLLRIFDGDLPEKKKPRKRLKPDLEALVQLPAFATAKFGALFAIGSGSRQNRQSGVLLALDARGAIAAAPRVIDLSALFAPLEAHVGDLNIEGAVIVKDRFILLQRGNKGGALNALITLNLYSVLAALSATNAIAALPFDVRTYELGSIKDVPLSFTDGCALPDGRIVFAAVAEDTADSYTDGPCAGAAVGLLAAEGHVERLEELRPSAKVEGVSAHLDKDRIRLLLVTDADDVDVAAVLYEGQL